MYLIPVISAGMYIMRDTYMEPMIFKDANGIELKPGDVVLRAIGSQFVERRIDSITFSASTRMGVDGITPVPVFNTYVKTSGKGGHTRWHKPDQWYRKGKLYTEDSNRVIKKVG